MLLFLLMENILWWLCVLWAVYIRIVLVSDRLMIWFYYDEEKHVSMFPNRHSCFIESHWVTRQMIENDERKKALDGTDGVDEIQCYRSSTSFNLVVRIFNILLIRLKFAPLNFVKCKPCSTLQHWQQEFNFLMSSSKCIPGIISMCYFPLYPTSL